MRVLNWVLSLIKLNQDLIEAVEITGLYRIVQSAPKTERSQTVASRPTICRNC